MCYAVRLPSKHILGFTLMKFRSLVLLGLAAVLGLSAPAFAAAQSTTTTSAAQTPLVKPKAKKPVAKTTQKTGKVAKAKAKKPVNGTEQAQARPVGLFALFRPAERARPAPKAVVQVTGMPRAKVKREVALSSPPELTPRGNEGELRSERSMPKSGFFAALFGDQQVMLPQTRALDAALAQRDSKSTFRVKSDFEPQSVAFSGYNQGTIVIDTGARYLYLVESSSTARRYAIAVGREGLEFRGRAKIGDKQEWPRWIPTKEMQQREPRKYGQYKDGMPGGPDNPLGARAIYLYQGRHDTHVRIHGTNQPQSIGTNASNGCFRMVNEHVKDLYSRVKVGTEVVVM